MKIALILILAFLIFSCKKDSVDKYVFFPLPYFPVYPGSYWKYVDSNGDTTIYKTDDSYKESFYSIKESGYVSETMYVPFYEGQAVWGYKIHTGYSGSADSSPLTLVVSDSLPVGAYWYVSYFGSGTSKSKKITAKDTTITFNGKSYYPTIVIEEYYSSGPPYYIWLAKRFYTKDIGLVREDINNPIDSTVNVKLLIDYHINK